MNGSPTPTTMPAYTPAQERFCRLGRGLFAHYGINTYHDVEWSKGDLDPGAFAPDRLDPDQWARTARDAGMRFILLTTKHIDGFCLWPSRVARYGVQQSGYRGDVVAELAAACQRYGLELGLYYALWDFTHDTGDDAAYADFVRAQLDELLTQYGPVVELWFDGAWTKFTTGYRPGADKLVEMWKYPGTVPDLQAEWDAVCAPRWQWKELYDFVHARQPGTIVLNNSTTDFPGVPLFPVDARSGEKATGADGVGGAVHRQTVWSWQGREYVLPLQIETTLSRRGPDGAFASGSWFWHPWDHSVAPPEMVRGWVSRARQEAAVLVLNAGVTASGQLRAEDVAALTGLGATDGDGR